MAVRGGRFVLSRPGGRRRRALAAWTLLAGLTVASCSAGGPPSDVDDSEPPNPAPANIVMVLIDDMSMELLQYMPAARRMIDEGVTFDDMIVSTSLCCPSRATILSGQYPHNTDVLRNSFPHGGFGAYSNEMNVDIGSTLQDAGYRTGLLGKYLNEYSPKGYPTPADPAQEPPGLAPGFVPSGWNEFFVGDAYGEFNYTLTESVDGATSVVPHEGEDESDYFTDVLADRAVEFIDRAATDKALPDTEAQDPFALVVAPYAVHQRTNSAADREETAGPLFPAAPRDRQRCEPPFLGVACSPPPEWSTPTYEDGDCGATDPAAEGGCADVIFPDPTWTDSFNVLPVPTPTWIRREPLDQSEIDRAEILYLQRIRMIQAVSDLVDDVRAALQENGLEDSTYLMLMSDNGYALGQHRQMTRKGSAFDHDARVPMIIVPPGAKAGDGRTVYAIAQNTDVAATFADIANTTTKLLGDGRSLLPWVTPSADDNPVDWRYGALITLTAKDNGNGAAWIDGAGPISKFHAIRTEDYLYVDTSALDSVPPGSTDDGEFYDLATDPAQVVNLYGRVSPTDRDKLNSALRDYVHCAGSECMAIGASIPRITLDPPPSP